MSTPGSFTVSGPLAMISGRAAFILAAVLDCHLRNRHSLRSLLAEIGVDESDRAVALEAALNIAEAGEAWHFRARGNAETRPQPEALTLAPMVTIDTAEAAVLLCLGERQVRNLAAAGDLPAERTPGGPWRFLHRDVVGLRERRAGRAA